ncbi:MAG: NAD-dependent epimerase/dehydratase family protein [Promethearchaeota archaeon]
MTRVLVTGAKGHTGTFLVDLLLKKGCEVVATDLPPRERSALMTKEKVFRDDLRYMNIEEWEGVEFIPADLTDKESLRALFKGESYDVIYHPASFYDYFALIDILRKINVEGLRNFLDVIHEECGGKFPRFMHWSTCGVYGEPEYKRDRKTKMPFPSDETAPYNPPNAYSTSKMEQEILLKELGEEFDIPWTIIRPAPIYGPYQMYGAYHIFYMINKLGHFVRPSIYPKHHQLMMPMIHVETLVEAAWFLSQRDDTIHEAYNVCEDEVSSEEWLEFVCQALGVTYTHIPVPWFFYKGFAVWMDKMMKRKARKARAWGIRPKFDPSMSEYTTHNYFFSNAKLKALGFELKYTCYEGTIQTIRWYKDHGWLESENFKQPADYLPGGSGGASAGAGSLPKGGAR